MIKPDNNSGIFRLVNEVECGSYRVNGGKSIVKVERYNDSTRCVSPASSFNPNKYEVARLVIDNDVKVEDRWVKDIQAEHLVSKTKVVKLNSSYYNAETLREEILVPRNYIKLPDGKFLLNRVNRKDFVSLLIVNTVPGFAMTCIEPCQVNADGEKWSILFGDFYESMDGKKCFSVKGEADSNHFLIVHESKGYQEGTVLDLSENALFHQRISVNGAFQYFYVLKSGTSPGDIIAKRAEKLVMQK